MSSLQKLIIIEGNIGSGKSTLLNALKEHFRDDEKYIFVPEPIHIWNTVTDENGVPILVKFYEDPKAYAFPFQMMAYISRLALIKESIKQNPDSIIISERSLITDRHVFAQMLYDAKMISEECMKIYTLWFDAFVNDIHITHRVYVKTLPEKCYQRIYTRNRDGESNITQSYLNNCDLYHDQMINAFTEDPILIIDGNIDYDPDNVVINQHLIDIKTFINT